MLKSFVPLYFIAAFTIGFFPNSAWSEQFEKVRKLLASYEHTDLQLQGLSCPQSNSRGPASISSSIRLRYTTKYNKVENELEIKVLAGNAESVSRFSKADHSLTLSEEMTWKSFKPSSGEFYVDAKGRHGEYLLLTRSQKDVQTKQLEKLIPQLISCCESSACRRQMP